MDRVERLEAVVEEPLGFARPHCIGARAQHDSDLPPLAALCRRDEAPSGGIGVARLHAVDVGIDPEKPVAVGLRDVVVAEFLDRIELVVIGIIADQRRGERAEVARGRIMIGLRESGDISEVRVGETHALRLGIHAHDERGFTSLYKLRQRDRCIVAGLHDHSAQQLVDRHRAAWLDEHPRTLGVPCRRRHRHALRRHDLAFAQRGERQVRRHELRERRRFAALVGVLLDDRRATREIEQ